MQKIGHLHLDFREMIEMKNVVLATALMIVLSSCYRSDLHDMTLSGSVFESDMPAVELKFSGNMDGEYCIPAWQVSPLYGSFRVYSLDNREVRKNSVADRNVQEIRDVDLSDGLIVVGDRSKSIIIRLDNYDIGIASIKKLEFDIQYFSCKDFFDGRFFKKKKTFEIFNDEIRPG